VSRQVIIQPLTADAFAPFGEIIDASGAPTVMINQGNCARYTDRAALDFAPEQEGRAAISIFEGEPYALPLTLEMVERHPLGSQAFIPMSADPFLVIVAPDEQGAKSLFAVVDRVGGGNNLEEHWFSDPYHVAEE